MQQVTGYNRPSTLPEALSLLSAPNARPLAGGTSLRHQPGADPVDLVDLQSLGLDGIGVDGREATVGRVTVGSMVRLQTLVDNTSIPDVVRDAAQAEAPSTLRTLATIGGVVADPAADSILLTALLAYDTSVDLVDSDGANSSILLPEFLSSGVQPGQLVVSVSVATDGDGAVAQTGRTPADTPIVAAVARRSTGGDLTMAVCGLADTPILVDVDDLATLDPPPDFRGSSRYRLRLAEVLTNRVAKELSR